MAAVLLMLLVDGLVAIGVSEEPFRMISVHDVREGHLKPAGKQNQDQEYQQVWRGSAHHGQGIIRGPIQSAVGANIRVPETEQKR